MCKVIEWSELDPKWVSQNIKRGQFPKCGVKYVTMNGSGLVLTLPTTTNQLLIRAKIAAARIKATKVYACELPESFAAIASGR